MKKAVAKMFSAAKHDAKKEFDLKEDELVVGVASAGIDPERELEYLERAKAEFPDAKVFINRPPFSVAVHTGPGALGIGIRNSWQIWIRRALSSRAVLRPKRMRNE